MFLGRSESKLMLQASFGSKELIKAIGSYKWNKMFQLWEFPLNKVTAIMDNLKVETTPEVQELYKEYKEIEQERQRKIDYINNLPNLDSKYPGFFKHQKSMLEAAKQFDSYCLFAEPGTGKTKVFIELFLIKKPNRALIICPLNIITAVWEEEIQKWHPELKFCNLWKQKILKEEYNIYLINFEQFRNRVDELIEFGFPMVMIDESSKLKDSKSLITKAALKIAEAAIYRYIGSGTPAPNSILEFWGQLAFVNKDLLSDNFYRFRATYFTSFGYGGHQYGISNENREKIMQKIKEQAIFFAKKDALDLPEQIFEKRYMEMDKEQTKVYKQMLTENIAYFKEKAIIGQTELTKILKLREVTSGFAFDDQGIPLNISNSKLDTLFELLEEIGDHQVCIFINFRWEEKMIKERLGDKAVVLSGSIPQKEKDKNIEMFKDDVTQYLIANMASASHGLNLQNCHYAIYFSLSYSHELHRQSQDRFHRGGQKNKVTYFYILAKKTIDEVLYKVLIKKADILEACMEMLKRGV